MKRQQNKRKAATFHLVRYDSTLLEYLLENFKDKSRTTIKSYLSHRQIASMAKQQRLLIFLSSKTMKYV